MCPLRRERTIIPPSVSPAGGQLNSTIVPIVPTAANGVYSGEPGVTYEAVIIVQHHRYYCTILISLIDSLVIPLSWERGIVEFLYPDPAGENHEEKLSRNLIKI